MARHRRISTALSAALLAGLAPAWQQNHTPGLQDRNREILHPGGALELVGIEEGDNSFRDRTPTLEHTDRRTAYVDLDTARGRHMALYEGHSFHAPVERKLVGGSERIGTPAQRARVAMREDDEPAGGGGGAILPMLLVGAMAGLLVGLSRLLKA